MQLSFAFLAALAGTALAQGVTDAIKPQAPTPAGCQDSYSGKFTITVYNATAPPSSKAKRGLGLHKRQNAGVLTLTLDKGILLDQAGRTGYIADNFQFQFDKPAQTGAIYTAGFSVCSNGSLALGGSAIWYQCKSGDFFNLYDRSWAPQCSAIYLVGSGGAPSVPAVSGTATVITSSIVSLKSDGQPVNTPAAIPVSQLADGQPQGPTGLAPVSQRTDGQIIAPTGAPSSAPAPAPAPAPVTQISDGQIQGPTGAPNATFTKPAPPATFTGAAPSAAYQVGAVAVGVLGGLVAML